MNNLVPLENAIMAEIIDLQVHVTLKRLAKSAKHDEIWLYHENDTCGMMKTGETMHHDQSSLQHRHICFSTSPSLFIEINKLIVLN